MKGQVPEDSVKELSSNRANAVKEAIIKKFPSLQPNQFSVSGLGWQRPADPADPIEPSQESPRGKVKVYPLESQK